MSQIIAGTYEILGKIGSGGGGIVYLGRHLRLDKEIVLKADKRSLAAKQEVLRREVDMLKGLSHRYIPQVYDFVEQDGIVYTVMDYIEGESLDKLLKRGEIPSQPKVIAWAAQLLEALSYLHSRPPHGILHGDIKPANIMLRPNGDICLIDYNIALALGEDGAVKVGGSRGYASPEHYGSCYISQETDQDRLVGMPECDPEEADTLTMKSLSFEEMSYSGSSRRAVKLDVRSDIYSLGATLYHLLSGVKPQQDALKVVPLTKDVCSPAIAAIIEKAMSPDPNMRFQTADEMYDAFRMLYRNDRRVVRHRRRMASAALLSIVMLSAGGAATFTGLKQMESRQEAFTLSEYSKNSLEEGNRAEAVRLALKAIPEGESIFYAPVTAQAQKALTDALGVYDLSDGYKSDGIIDLPSAPFYIAKSPMGRMFAVVCSGEILVFDTEEGELLAELATSDSALCECVFSDEDRVIFSGKDGIAEYSISEKRILWSGEEATAISLSGDKGTIAAVNRDESKAIIYNADNGKIIMEKSFDGKHMAVAANDIFANPNNNIFSLNHDGSMLAVSFSDGGLRIYDLNDSDGDMIIYDTSEYGSFGGGFCGNYFAFCANKSDQSIFGLIDTTDAFYLGGQESRSNYHICVNEEGIFLANGGLLVRFDKDTLEEKELAYSPEANITGFSADNGYVLTATDDNAFSFYDSRAQRVSYETGEKNYDFVYLLENAAITANRSDPEIRLMRLEQHEDTQLLSYDGRYIHDEARISADGKTVMLFDYQGFRIYDMGGKLLTEERLPDAENIYDQQFIREESSSMLEVIWYDGTVRRYDAGTGELRSEEKKAPPDKSLYEEFYTEKYRIASYLHEPAQVYESDTGKLVATLSENDYLTYVTETDEGIMTEYVTAEGERYGLLLNEKFEVVAYLPCLCDIKDDVAYFDYKNGNLRQCRLYSLPELIALGETYFTKEE